MTRKLEEKMKKAEEKETAASARRELRREERLKRRGDAQRPQRDSPTKKERLDLPQFKLVEYVKSHPVISCFNQKVVSRCSRVACFFVATVGSFAERLCTYWVKARDTNSS